MGTDEHIEEYLKAVSASNVMGRSKRKLALLEYLIRAEANDDGEKLKAYSIGLDVFGKEGDFDPSTDSSVRVEIGRLRTAIALFEASDTAKPALKVDIPVGSYRPEITMRDDKPITPTQPKTTPKGRSRPRVTYVTAAVAAVVVAVTVVMSMMFLFNRTPNQVAQRDSHPISLSVQELEGDALGKDIARLVKRGFTNHSVVKILDSKSLRTREGHFEFRGNVTDQLGFSRVSVELADLKTRQIVWSHVFRLGETADLENEIDIKLNGELHTRLLGAAKVLLAKRDPQELSPQQLFVLATWVSGPAVNSLAWETERVDLMKIALSKDPDFGPAHSVLADKYGFLANVYESWDTPENLDLAKFHARRAAELSPSDANVMFNVAQSYWHTGRHAESRRTFERVVELDSGNTLARFFARLMPYWCGEVPDDAMNWAVNFDRSLSKDDPIRWIVLTWIATLHTNRGEYGLALNAATKAAQIFQVGYTYMAHAMLLNKAGDIEAAIDAIKAQHTNWPGIGAAHYSNSTVPRLCAEQPNAQKIIADYAQLTEAAVGKLGE